MLTGQVGSTLCPERSAQEAQKGQIKKKKKEDTAKCLHVLTVLSIRFSVANANDVHVFGCEVLGALGEVAHYREQPPKVKLKEGLWVCVQQGLQGLVKSCLSSDLCVVMGTDEAAIYGVPYGLEHQVALVQVLGVLDGGVLLQHVV